MSDELKNIIVSIGATFLMGLLFFVILFVLSTVKDPEEIEEDNHTNPNALVDSTPLKTSLSTFVY